MRDAYAHVDRGSWYSTQVIADTERVRFEVIPEYFALKLWLALFDALIVCSTKVQESFN